MSAEFKTAGNPYGEQGKAMLARMNQSHESLTRWALGFVPFASADHVLEIGCGGGQTIQRILGLLEGGHVTGIDHSKLAVEETSALNGAEIEAGRVDVKQASVSRLPFADDTFDVITGFETIYFWPHIEADLREVLRVLRPGGTLLIANDASIPGTQELEEIKSLVELPMTVYSPEELKRLFEEAGFVEVVTHVKDGTEMVCALGTKR